MYHTTPTLAEASDWLFEDSNPRRAVATLRQLQETDRHEAEARARRKARRPAKAKRTELRAVQAAA